VGKPGVPLEGRTVLEYGCGNGAVAAAFAPHVGRHMGLDIDEAAVRQGRELLGQHGVDASLRAVPLGEIMGEVAAMRGEIDLFLCYAVLEHMTVEERLELLDLAQQVIRPDGASAVIETPNRLLPWDHHTSHCRFSASSPDELADHRNQLALQAVLDEIDPDLPPSFSRYWLDLVTFVGYQV
jgi:2-polyprenyl-3-methyl-5-hydroxy-6-metoxy-1,4-benzoquinol methylase